MKSISVNSDELPQTIIVDLPCLDFYTTWKLQNDIVEARKKGNITNDIILFLEHEPVFTLGRRGGQSNLIVSREFLKNKNIDLVKLERGGDITFHGPGQIVVYPILDLKAKGFGVAEYVERLEEIMMATAMDFGVTAGRNSINRGVFVGKKKLGSVGVAVQKSIAFHGFALNVNPSLEPFSWIHPCGLKDVEMTSLENESTMNISMGDAFTRVRHHVEEILKIASNRIDYNDFLEDIKEISFCKNMDENPVAKGRKPGWLKRNLPSGAEYETVRTLIKEKRLNTVCQKAMCPNLFECFSNRTATFLIMGERCTRKCRFCAIDFGPKELPDPDEPKRVARSAESLNLNYVVVTSVTRDDIPDGGAIFFAKTIREIQKRIPDVKIEVLIPDFNGNMESLKTVLDAGPAVLNHNIETVPRLYTTVRPEAQYKRSLELLRHAGAHASIPIKSGLMLGLGETAYEVEQVLLDLFGAGCRILTLGQYLQPSKSHLEVHRFVPPEEFDEWRKEALNMGFQGVASGPFVRSSYHAVKMFF